MSDQGVVQLEQETPQSDGGGCNGTEGRGLTPSSFQKLCGDLGTLIRVPDMEYSDLTIIVDGKRFPVHRCILAARCPGLRRVFAGMEQSDGSKLELELSSVVGGERIGHGAFVAVMGYVYGGTMEPWPAVIPCYDSSCGHVTCRPAIDYVLEILLASLLLDLPEVKNVTEQHLIDCMGRLQVDDMLHVHRSISTTECPQLQSACLTVLASSKLDNLTLEREFSGEAPEQVRKLRKELGFDTTHLTPVEEKQCKRIHRALDSDDIELVQLLLDEKKLSLDGAHGLHYAAAYCHPRTLAHLLDLGLADTNIRNERGMTVLHVAAWRREPQALANLLEKGAHLKELTLDNQTALDISKRLTKKLNADMKAESQKDRLCMSILEQAERRHTVTVPKSAAAMLTEPSTEQEFMSLLLYLENRVALAKLLYPQEADIIMGISQLDSYYGFTAVHVSGSGGPIARRSLKKPSVDLNDEPAQRLAGLVGVAVVDESEESRLESLRQRCDTLKRVVEVGRRYFPCYSAVIDKYVLDDDPVEMNDEGNPEDQLLKKRHFAEIKGILQDSSTKSKTNDQKKIAKPLKTKKKPRVQDSTVVSSSSSTSSSRGTSGSMVTKL
ncbi:hypothetical protein KC19_11G011600 [Ceratodon purpureus]|uniref:BTB domain-containing protein n=1 Tax=Ceratodon purpureus TaxID=3225 RepID=A0A8T0G9A6_CERPU|nr:hypothetical protein KC19_11G011600 [Ceratodon purpureus]